MHIETRFGPTATIAVCQLEKGETLIAEGGALMAMSGPISITTTTRQSNKGGIVAGLKRVLSGESFFLNHYLAKETGEVWLGTPLPGDIMLHRLQGESLMIAGGGYIGAEEGVAIDLQWQGAKSFFSGEGLFWIKAQGKGQVIIGSFGFIFAVDVDGEYFVDTGHIVVFENTLNFEISKSTKSWMDAFFSGEGFVCRFKGRGKVWCQSHNTHAFGSSLRPYLRAKKS